MSHLLLLSLEVLPISHPNLLFLLQLLYPKTPRNGSKARWSKKKWKRKRSIHPTRTTQSRKRQCPAKQRQSKEKKPITAEEWKLQDKEKPMTKKECTLETEVLVNLDHGWIPFGIFQMVTGMNNILEVIVTEMNRYATQQCCNFETTQD